MTRDEIEALSGRELDTAVAEHVFGLIVEAGDAGVRWVGLNPGQKPIWTAKNTLDRYHDNPIDARRVRQRMQSLGFIWSMVYIETVKQYDCRFWKPISGGPYSLGKTKADTEELAVCRAALLALASQP